MAIAIQNLFKVLVPLPWWSKLYDFWAKTSEQYISFWRVNIGRYHLIWISVMRTCWVLKAVGYWTLNSDDWASRSMMSRYVFVFHNSTALNASFLFIDKGQSIFDPSSIVIVQCPLLSSMIMAAAFSPIMMIGAFVFPPTMSGIALPSATRRPC